MALNEVKHFVNDELIREIQVIREIFDADSRFLDRKYQNQIVNHEFDDVRLKEQQAARCYIPSMREDVRNKQPIEQVVLRTDEVVTNEDFRARSWSLVDSRMTDGMYD